MHKELGNLPDVSLHKCMYFPMSDTGMFGSYFHGNEVHGPQMLFMGQLFASDLALYLKTSLIIFYSENIKMFFIIILFSKLNKSLCI